MKTETTFKIDKTMSKANEIAQQGGDPSYEIYQVLYNYNRFKRSRVLDILLAIIKELLKKGKDASNPIFEAVAYIVSTNPTNESVSLLSKAKSELFLKGGNLKSFWLSLLEILAKWVIPSIIDWVEDKIKGKKKEKNWSGDEYYITGDEKPFFNTKNIVTGLMVAVILYAGYQIFKPKK